MASRRRCEWARSDLMAEYHDKDWGVATHDDRRHFEFLVLEAAQAGLSWETVLKRRDAYRKAFAGFDPVKVARFDARAVKRLLADPGIIRNRLKVSAAIRNAQRFLEVQREFGSFDKYIRAFAPKRPRAPRRLADIPAQTPEAAALSKDLRERGFTFVGPVIVYAHMQAVGIVNDHVVGCFRRTQVARTRRG
jgi:DNA-3-methyladenine glycosylase I